MTPEASEDFVVSVDGASPDADTRAAMLRSASRMVDAAEMVAVRAVERIEQGRFTIRVTAERRAA